MSNESYNKYAINESEDSEETEPFVNNTSQNHFENDENQLLGHNEHPVDASINKKYPSNHPDPNEVNNENVPEMEVNVNPSNHPVNNEVNNENVLKIEVNVNPSNQPGPNEVNNANVPEI